MCVTGFCYCILIGATFYKFSVPSPPHLEKLDLEQVYWKMEVSSVTYCSSSLILITDLCFIAPKFVFSLYVASFLLGNFFGGNVPKRLKKTTLQTKCSPQKGATKMYL